MSVTYVPADERRRPMGNQGQFVTRAARRPDNLNAVPREAPHIKLTLAQTQKRVPYFKTDESFRSTFESAAKSSAAILVPV